MCVTDQLEQLLNAHFSQKWDEVERLVREGVNPRQDQKARNLLHDAALAGKSSLVEALISKAGYDPNGLETAFDSRPIFLLSRMGLKGVEYRPTVEVLVKAGADPKWCPEGFTYSALDAALHRGDKDLATLLKDYGVPAMRRAGKAWLRRAESQRGWESH